MFAAFFGLLLAALVSGQVVDIRPREVVRRTGQDVTVLCKVDYEIDSCRVTIGSSPTASYRLDPEKLVGDIVYAGQGLKNGECGAHIKNIQPNMNGNISCILPPQAGAGIELSATMRLIVAKAPEPPILRSEPQGIFSEGQRLDAQCEVAKGRPAARVTWFLDGELLLAGIHEPIIIPEPDSDLQTVKVNVTRKLTAEDGGKILACRAEHEDLDRPMEASMQLIVNYPPRREDGTDSKITIFGLKLGSEGRLNVTVRASPPPTAVWRVNAQELRAPSQNDDGTILALEPSSQGNGLYNVTLVLRRVEKADVDRVYFLHVSNNQGDASFELRISTMDEPAGVELDTGAVVGIVIAALVLLIAVSLLVFAKATDRWCFAGDRDPTKSSGESDTESAAGGRRRESRVNRARTAALGAWGRVRAAMPKGRDKVQASETAHDADEEKPAEKKEGVVYAELALTETGAREAEHPQPPSTEYAEIVYTDQGKKEAKE